MAEWFKAHAWKACVAKHYREFKSHSLRHFDFIQSQQVSQSPFQTAEKSPGPARVGNLRGALPPPYSLIVATLDWPASASAHEEYPAVPQFRVFDCDKHKRRF